METILSSYVIEAMCKRANQGNWGTFRFIKSQHDDSFVEYLKELFLTGSDEKLNFPDSPIERTAPVGNYLYVFDKPLPNIDYSMEVKVLCINPCKIYLYYLGDNN